MATVGGKERIQVYPPWKLKYWECLIFPTLRNPYQQNSALISIVAEIWILEVSPVYD